MEEQYRIVQVSEAVFHVERLWHFTKPGRWPWSKGVSAPEWIEVWKIPGKRISFPFPSQAAAQKFIDDKRKYPIVVKQPA